MSEYFTNVLYIVGFSYNIYLMKYHYKKSNIIIKQTIIIHYYYIYSLVITTPVQYKLYIMFLVHNLR